MSQDDVYNLLKRKGKLTISEISEKLSVGKGSISANLKRLIERGDVRVYVGIENLHFPTQKPRNIYGIKK